MNLREGLTIQAMDQKLSFALQIAYLIKLKIAQGNNATVNIHSPLASIKLLCEKRTLCDW